MTELTYSIGPIATYYVMPKFHDKGEGYEVIGNNERYEFKLKEFAESFCKILNEYYIQKYLETTQITLTNTTSMPRMIDSSYVFQINFAGESYCMKYGKKLNNLQKFMLYCMGFKRCK